MEFSYNYAENKEDDADGYSSMSVIGLIFAILFSLVGLVISTLAHSEAERTGSRKSLSLSKIGIIVSAVRLAVVTVALVVLIGLLIAGLLSFDIPQFI